MSPKGTSDVRRRGSADDGGIEVRVVTFRPGFALGVNRSFTKRIVEVAMPSDFSLLMGPNTPTARQKLSGPAWLLVVLCLPLLAACLMFDAIYFVIARL